MSERLVHDSAVGVEGLGPGLRGASLSMQTPTPITTKHATDDDHVQLKVELSEAHHDHLG
jgi:hypothetical protein